MRGSRAVPSCRSNLPICRRNLEPGKFLTALLRYARPHGVTFFDKALALLLKLRAETRKAEIGSVSQKQSEAQEARKAEVHTITMEIKKKRLEREKSSATIAGIKAGKELADLLPPDRQGDWEKLVAEKAPRAA